MFRYYQQMFNDTRYTIHDTRYSLLASGNEQLYLVWDKSKKTRLKIDELSLQKMCLGRFDGLSRKKPLRKWLF
ncbi:hypothetical protein [Psychromonas hadalis]|uniref:hypothetical protein n=1 Tax=Psychromonas hadalis TaxID=211669 RepID=UPI0003B6E31B|nr:hypothetical protein [Psychromonas hadalis]